MMEKQAPMKEQPSRVPNGSAIKAVIFDYDGVLVDSLHIGFEAYQEIAAFANSKGFSTVDEFKEAQTQGYLTTMKEWGIVTPEQIRMAGIIYQESTKKRHGSIRLPHNLKKTLDELSKKYTLAICSATYVTIISDALSRHGLHGYFRHITGHEDYRGKTKPDPMVIQTCLARLNIKPHEAVYVGDMVHDIRMGKAANIKTIIVHGSSWNTKDTLASEKPDVLIEAFSDLCKVLS